MSVSPETTNGQSVAPITTSVDTTAVSPASPATPINVAFTAVKELSFDSLSKPVEEVQDGLEAEVAGAEDTAVEAASEMVCLAFVLSILHTPNMRADSL